MPFISGKDSLFNEFEGEAIPGTLLISALGIVPDLHQVVTSAVATIGDDLWLVGEGSPGLGGSLAAEILGLDAIDVAAPLTDPLPRYRAIHELIRAGHAHAAHDCSEGGLAVALAEMAIGGRLGVRATVADSGSGSLATLVNEAPGRVVLATDREARDDVERVLGGLGCRIGEVSGGDSITIAVGSPGEGTGAARMKIEPMTVRLDDAVEAFSGPAEVDTR
jgi:phosphoribosylformylglycinamidine synthase